MTAASGPTGLAKVAMIGAVMLAMMLEMLDMTVVNVALPHMMGSFGATNDQITWVVTSYMVSSAIVMPLTGYLVQRFGRQRLLLIDITFFLIASAACGAAQSLEQMVIFRVLQGAAGGTLAPLSQSVMMSTFTRENRGSAMAVWGLGMMVIPVLGPTFGGFLTDHLSWRWVFYVNVPTGLLAFLLAAGYVPSEPGYRARTDWFGLILAVVFVGSLQFMLTQGNTSDWFNSPLIQVLAVTTVVAGLGFISRCWDRPGAIVNLAVYRDRNYALSSIIMIGFSMCMFGIMTMLPLMLEQLMGYPAQATGSVMTPRGLIMALAMVLFGRFAGKFDGRLLMVLGLAVLAMGTYVYALLPITASSTWMIVPGIVQGVGMAMFFIPSAMLAYETLPKHLFDAAAGLYSVTRTLGASLGISVIGLTLQRRADYHWQTLNQHVTATNPNVQSWLDAYGLNLSDPTSGAMLVGTVMQQAQTLAFGDVFRMVAILPLIVAPLVFLRRKSQPTQKSAK